LRALLWSNVNAVKLEKTRQELEDSLAICSAMAYQKKAKIKRGKDFALQSVWEDMHSGIQAA
jgi:hypothetical protein